MISHKKKIPMTISRAKRSILFFRTNTPNLFHERGVRRSCLTFWYGQRLFLAATQMVWHFCCAVLWVDVFHPMLLLFVLKGLSAREQVIHTLGLLRILKSRRGTVP